VESYERAQAHNPNYAEVHFNLALLAMNQGQHEEAGWICEPATKDWCARRDFSRFALTRQF
jgi:hypothetical protein